MMNKKISFFLALVVVLAFAVSSMAAIPVEVSIGKGTVLTLKKLSKRISLSDPSIADLVVISPTELLINGKKVGTTSLIVWDKKDGKRTFFDVFVVGDIGELIEQVSAIAPPDSDVTIEMVKDSILLKGNLKNQDTINKINKSPTG
jgi:pilus assembly protein CpaC